MAHTQWQGYGGTGTELYEHGEDGEVPHLELEPRDRARGATAGSSSTPLPDAPVGSLRRSPTSPPPLPVAGNPLLPLRSMAFSGFSPPGLCVELAGRVEQVES